MSGGGYGTLPGSRKADAPSGKSGGKNAQLLSLDRLADTLHVKVRSIEGAFAAASGRPGKGRDAAAPSGAGGAAGGALPAAASATGRKRGVPPLRSTTTHKSAAGSSRHQIDLSSPILDESAMNSPVVIDEHSPPAFVSLHAKPVVSPHTLPIIGCSAATPANQLSRRVDSFTSSRSSDALTIGGEGWDSPTSEVAAVSTAAELPKPGPSGAHPSGEYAATIAKWQDVKIPPLPLAPTYQRLGFDAVDAVPPPVLKDLDLEEGDHTQPPRVKRELPAHLRTMSLVSTLLDATSFSRDFTVSHDDTLPEVSPPKHIHRVSSCDGSDSVFSSISSGPNILFPAEGDGLGWVHIPDVGSDSDSDWQNIPRGDISPSAPLLNRQSKLPDVAGLFLDKLDYWVANHAPQLPTRAHMHIVHDDAGMAYGSIVPAGTTDPRAAGGRRGGAAAPRGRRPLKKILGLPRLPNEIESLKVFRDGRRVYLAVELARPWLAWCALALAFAFETLLTFQILHDSEAPAGGAPYATLFDTPLSVYHTWLTLGLLACALAAMLTGWVLGDFDDPRIDNFMRSRYGMLLTLLLIVSYGGFLWPFVRYDSTASSSTLIWSAPIVLLALAKVCRRRSITARLALGVALTGAAVGLAIYTTADSAPQEWGQVLLGGSCLSLYFYCAKQIRPHLPLSLLLLLSSLGGLGAQLPYCIIDAADTQIAFLGFADTALILPYLGLAALACAALSACLWSLMYLSPLTVCAPFSAHRLVALAIEAYLSPPVTHLGMRVALLVCLITGVLVLCSIDLVDRERKVKLTDPDAAGTRNNSLASRSFDRFMTDSKTDSKTSMSLQSDEPEAEEVDEY